MEEFLQARVVTFANPYSLSKLMRSKVPLERFDKICIDGVALKVFLNLVYRDSSIQRLSFDFTSVAHPVFSQAAARQESGFILGSDQASNDEFLSRIRDMFPGVKLNGRSGYFTDDAERSALFETLAASSSDFIVIGMGAINQENAANALVELGYPGRVYTCGGFIHQTAMSGGEYYPSWVDRYNLRFAYRMLKEPSTVRRYLVDYPMAFGLFVLKIRNFRR